MRLRGDISGKGVVLSSGCVLLRRAPLRIYLLGTAKGHSGRRTIQLRKDMVLRKAEAHTRRVGRAPSARGTGCSVNALSSEKTDEQETQPQGPR